MGRADKGALPPPLLGKPLTRQFFKNGVKMASSARRRLQNSRAAAFVTDGGSPQSSSINERLDTNSIHVTISKALLTGNVSRECKAASMLSYVIDRC